MIPPAPVEVPHRRKRRRSWYKRLIRYFQNNRGLDIALIIAIVVVLAVVLGVLVSRGMTILPVRRMSLIDSKKNTCMHLEARDSNAFLALHSGWA